MAPDFLCECSVLSVQCLVAKGQKDLNPNSLSLALFG